MAVECEVCKKTLSKVALFRQNPIGEIGIWRCFEHNKTPIDSEVLELVKIFENGQA